MKTKQKTLTATEFKAKCLRVLEDLDSQGVVVLKRGRPIARVTPISSGNKAEFFGCMKGKIKIKGDIFSTGVKWNAQS
jgi:antitoxin (DNA-binding transcriptional repressor) of toxin-antitoxin stability system